MPFSEPEKVLKQFFIGKDWRIADFGAGSGGYTLGAARYTHDGRVYAIDIQKGLLAKIKKDAEQAGLSNVDVVWGDVEEPGGSHLKEDAVDAVILANILFQVEEKKKVIEEAKRVLRSRGRVLVVDWTDSFGGLGPAQESVFSKEKARELFESLGFEYEHGIEAGEHHYGVIFKKNK